MFNRFLLYSSTVLFFFASGCEKYEAEPPQSNNCGHGYGPDDCSKTWASAYVGDWSGESCGNTFLLDFQ